MTLPVKIKRMVAAGDSLTDAAAWPDWVATTLRENGHPDLVLRNAAVCGEMVSDLIRRAEEDIFIFKPDLVVVLIGSNDIRNPVEAFRPSLDSFLQLLVSSGTAVVQLTLPPMKDHPDWSEKVAHFNEDIRELTEKHGVIMGDLNARFNEGLAAGQDLIEPDGVHHTFEGWRVLGRCVIDTLGCTAPMNEEIQLFPGSVTDWFLSPPVDQDAETLADNPGFCLDPGFNPTAAGWTKFDRSAVETRAPWPDVSAIQRGAIAPAGLAPGALAFALAIIHSDTEKKIRLMISDFAVSVVWLNGVPAARRLTGVHGLHPDAIRPEVTLKKGENRVLVLNNYYFYLAIA